MRCLLVDYEDGIREGLAMLLRRRGHEVRTAHDCRSAAEALASQAFDAVVTDWRLPDGLASSFSSSAECPVVAMSGHPDEVERAANTTVVLAKPVHPNDLLAQLERAVAAAATPCDEPCLDDFVDALAADVRRVVQDVLAQLPGQTEVRCDADEAFVFVRARLPEDYVPMVRPLGGDLRIVESVHGRELELRLCRDGRPDVGVPVVPFGAGWTIGQRVAVDCSEVPFGESDYLAWLDGVAELDGHAGRICLIHVPEHLESATAVWETTHDMPMREPVGPRLPAELTELWS